ncbi:hypothetical protein K439DRAFT_1614680 [Ramaria rubella]|nr:hypothetical protein K439DRAFT_1614680 [Ramaria rubella]
MPPPCPTLLLPHCLSSHPATPSHPYPTSSQGSGGVDGGHGGYWWAWEGAVDGGRVMDVGAVGVCRPLAGGHAMWHGGGCGGGVEVGVESSGGERWWRAVMESGGGGGRHGRAS